MPRLSKRERRLRARRLRYHVRVAGRTPSQAANYLGRKYGGRTYYQKLAKNTSVQHSDLALRKLDRSSGANYEFPYYATFRISDNGQVETWSYGTLSRVSLDNVKANAQKIVENFNGKRLVTYKGRPPIKLLGFFRQYAA